MDDAVSCIIYSRFSFRIPVRMLATTGGPVRMFTTIGSARSLHSATLSAVVYVHIDLFTNWLNSTHGPMTVM